MIYEKEHISLLIRKFIEEIIHPYRELNVQMSEQWLGARRGNNFDYNHVIHRLIHLKNAAADLIRNSDGMDEQPAERAQFNKCVSLFIAAVEQQIQTLNSLGYSAASQDQQQSQHYLTSMSKNLAALKQSLKKEG